VSQIERILDAVLASEMDDKKSAQSEKDKKPSLVASIERGSLLSFLDEYDFGNSAAKQDQSKVTLKILQELDLDKINILKHVYSICDLDDDGFISVDKVKESNQINTS